MSSLRVLFPWLSWVCFRPLFSQTQCDSPTGIPIRWGHVSDTCYTHVSGATHSSCLGFRCLENPTPALESLITINCVHVITALLSWHPWSRGTRPHQAILHPCSCVPAVQFSRVPLYKLFNLAWEALGTMHFTSRSNISRNKCTKHTLYVMCTYYELCSSWKPFDTNLTLLLSRQLYFFKN